MRAALHNKCATYLCGSMTRLPQFRACNGLEQRSAENYRVRLFPSWASSLGLTEWRWAAYWPSQS